MPLRLRRACAAFALVLLSIPAAARADAPVGVVAYVKHTSPPWLLDESSPGWAFGAVGAMSEVASGNSLAGRDGIEDPGIQVAHDIAAAWAASHGGGQVSDTPILSDRARGQSLDSPESLAKQAAGAAFVVDADPSALAISNFRFDWNHFDLDYIGAVRIIDAVSAKVVASAHCRLSPEHRADLPTHAELLADGGAKLKALIASKRDACLAKLKTDLKL